MTIQDASESFLTTENAYSDFDDTRLPFNDEWLNEDKRRCKRIDKFFPSKYRRKSFKEVVRYGIGTKQRHTIYLLLSGLDKKLNDIRPIWHDIVTNNSTPADENIITKFGCPDYEFDTPKDNLKKFLTIFVNQNHIDTFSPSIPSVASILYTSFQPEVAYFILQSMYENDDKYFTKSKREFTVMLNTIEYILSKNSRLYNKTKLLKIDFHEVALFMIPLFFTKKIDRRVSNTIFDSFIHDGKSVFIRYVVGIIIILQPKLLKANSAIEFMNTINDYITSIVSPPPLNNLIHITFSQKHSKSKKVMSCQNKEEQKITKLNDEIINTTITSPLPTIENFAAYHQQQINKKINKSSSSPLILAKVVNGNLMTDIQFSKLKAKLPYTIFGKLNAYLVYKMSVEGSTFLTLVNKCKDAEMLIIVIKTKSKTIGAVLTEKLSFSYHGRYTQSNTFVFDLSNNAVYKKTADNNYCVSLQSDSLSIGGGELGIAIYIDEYFTHCSSYPCSTFNSPPLLSPNTKEDILEVEVYKLDK